MTEETRTKMAEEFAEKALIGYNGTWKKNVTPEQVREYLKGLIKLSYETGWKTCQLVQDRDDEE